MTRMDVDQDNANAAGMDVDEEAEAQPSDKIFAEMLGKAKALEKTDPAKATQAYRDIIFNKAEVDDPTARGREQAIGKLADFFVERKEAAEISKLSKELRPIFSELPKAKTAKIVRNLIDSMTKISGSVAPQIEMCRDCIEWCKGEKRTFLRQRVETRLAGLLLEESKYVESLDILSRVLAEVKKLDDKMLLVEIHLIECRTHYAVQNIAKSKAALTASKTNANAIHCPPLLQAEIDLWSGVVTAKEKDFRTAYSYFYEAFEAYNAADKEEKARTSLKYMLLSKIMHNRPKDTSAIVNSKTGLKYTGIDIEAIMAVAKAHEERSLKKFEAVREKYNAQLDGDGVIKDHLSDLNDTLMEQNLLKILEPFTKVEIAHVAELLELGLERTQNKLREMILDQKLNGTLDQGHGVLIVFEQEKMQSTYENALKTVKNTSEVLDTLYGIAKQLA